MSDNFSLIAKETIEDLARRALTPTISIRADHARALIDWAESNRDERIEAARDKAYKEGYDEALDDLLKKITDEKTQKLVRKIARELRA